MRGPRPAAQSAPMPAPGTPGPVRHSPPTGNEQWDWSKNQWESLPESPQSVLRRVKLDEIVEKYARDWMVALFSPLGMREVLEMELLTLMRTLHQSYESIMSMPVSRRKRLIEELAEQTPQKRR